MRRRENNSLADKNREVIKMLLLMPHGGRGCHLYRGDLNFTAGFIAQTELIL